MRVLFETIHGSHLYGCARPDSDVDVFRVVENDPHRVKARNASQIIDGLNDVTVVDLSTFMHYAASGAPQYVEAMWSHIPNIDVLGETFRFGFFPNIANTRNKYRGFAVKMWADAAKAELNGDTSAAFKKRRHAHRIGWSFSRLAHGRRFNPTLRAADWALIESEMDSDPLARWDFG